MRDIREIWAYLSKNSAVICKKISPGRMTGPAPKKLRDRARDVAVSLESPGQAEIEAVLAQGRFNRHRLTGKVHTRFLERFFESMHITQMQRKRGGSHRGRSACIFGRQEVYSMGRKDSRQYPFFHEPPDHRGLHYVKKRGVLSNVARVDGNRHFRNVHPVHLARQFPEGEAFPHLRGGHL